MIHGIVTRLISSKLWVTVGLAVAAAVYPDLDAETKMQIAGAIGAVYVVVQGFVDARTGQRPTD